VPCPVCKEPIEITFTNEEIEDIKKFITKNGRSPTYNLVCSKNHNFVVLISLREEKNKPILYVRDVVLTFTKKSSNSSNNLDWFKKHFG